MIGVFFEETAMLNRVYYYLVISEFSYEKEGETVTEVAYNNAFMSASKLSQFSIESISQTIMQGLLADDQIGELLIFEVKGIYNLGCQYKIQVPQFVKNLFGKV